jgi:Spx/MgsR family transcriptional regulator
LAETCSKQGRSKAARSAAPTDVFAPHVDALAGINIEGEMKTTIHGIKACDTMKKARAWLDGAGVAYDFHDYKAAGIDEATLRRWTGQVGWEVLLNRSGTTFRALPDASKTDLDEDKAIALMLAQPSMIKRPVLDVDGKLLVGFKPDQYAAAFS